MNKFKYEVGTTIVLRERPFGIFERYLVDDENYYGCREIGTLYEYSYTEEYLDHTGYPPEKPEETWIKYENQQLDPDKLYLIRIEHHRYPGEIDVFLGYNTGGSWMTDEYAKEDDTMDPFTVHYYIEVPEFIDE